MNALRELGWVDLTLLGMLVLSVAVGLWRGITFEIMSLLGWLVAYVIANAAGPFVAGLLPGGIEGGSMRLWVSYVVIFVVVLVGIGVLARMMRAFIAATPLSAVDHLMGGLFGVLRAGLVMLIIATAVSISPFARSKAWADSHGQVWLGLGLDAVKPLLPESLNSRLSS